MDLIATQLLIFVGYAGALLCALIGTFARNVYADGGFKLSRFWWDTPFSVVIAIIAGGTGAWLSLPHPVVYLLAVSGGYLGPKWLSNWLKKKSEVEIGSSSDDGEQ